MAQRWFRVEMDGKARSFEDEDCEPYSLVRDVGTAEEAFEWANTLDEEGHVVSVTQTPEETVLRALGIISIAGEMFLESTDTDEGLILDDIRNRYVD